MTLRTSLAFLALCAVLTGQDRPTAMGEIGGANLPALPIGPNDLIAVSVYGSPELSRTLRVSAEGEIRLPMVKQKIAARGAMPAEMESRVARALSEEDILVDPVVTVTIVEYHSRPISVAGAVRRPVTFQAWGRTTLLEALTRAEGLNSDAGPEILISRPGARMLQRIPVKGLIDAADESLNVALEGGEEVRVPQVGRVFVVGNVRRSGAFRIEDGFGMTVLKALAMAEGLAPYATKLAYVYQRGDGAPKETAVELRKILDRKSPDVALAANDILYIPDNRVQRVTLGALEKAIGFATATASGALVLGVNR
jgi:polysaccharide export outer membrane protein